MADEPTSTLSNSILTSIKMSLGIQPECTHFDNDIIMNINAALSVLTQIGVGPSTGYTITDAVDEWDDFIDGNLNFELVKQYVYLRVRRAFDPPINATIMQSLNNMISEYEFRLSVAAETPIVIAEEEEY